MEETIDFDKTIEYAVAYLNIEKKNLEQLIIENDTSANTDLISISRDRLAKVEEELLTYRRLLNDTIQIPKKHQFIKSN